MSSKNTGGVGFLGLLTLLFIGLKLTGHIAWSWIWVLAPIWIPIAMFLVFLFGAILVDLIIYRIKTLKLKKKVEEIKK